PGPHVDTGDGAGIPAESQSRAQRKDETLAGSVVTFIDISERKRAEAALRESEEKYRELIQNATYGIYRATVKGQFLDANPALVEMLGYGSEEELLAVNILDIYENPDDRYWILNRFRDAGGAAGFEVKWKRKDGTPISARLNGRARYGQDGSVKHFEVIVENMTARRILEQQLREAQKMEAVGRLAGGIAHDFNNLLMIVNGYAELTIQRCKEELSHEYAHQIILAQKRAAELVRQLLAFSRKQVLEPKVLNLNSLLTELSRMLPRIIGEDVELSFVLTEHPGLVQADPTQLEQVVVNLVVNARDAMPHGGNLRLETSSVHQEVSYSGDHPDVPQGDYVMLAVSDTGIGMDAKTRSHIFEPFFTTKEAGKGTGLGLATAYGTIKQSGGFIGVSSEPQRGTTFRIYLPEVQGAKPVLQIPRDSSELPGGTEMVLLVEDETAVRTVTRAVLESLGYKVLESANGAEALKVAALRREAIDVILTDLIMPGIRGPELVARLRELHPEAAIIYMSGHSDGILRIQELGKDAVFLQKPFSVNGLAQSLRTALDKNAAAHHKERGRCG
ncbi:MAG TPA: ATP-binding protein, partial [Candidatus Solibacter sp.]|nr:ATP-binding protein [Candidatus Solibacter sp.]